MLYWLPDNILAYLELFYFLSLPDLNISAWLAATTLQNQDKGYQIRKTQLNIMEQQRLDIK